MDTPLTTNTADGTTTSTDGDQVEHIRARYNPPVKKLGNWTTARRFDVRARRGFVVLDLRSPEIAEGDIDVEVELDHAMVKLLVPEDAVIDEDGLYWHGRGRVKDMMGIGSPGAGRRVVLRGAIRHGEIRVHRGGIAILSAMFTKEYVAELVRAHREGRITTMDDPARSA